MFYNTNIFLILKVSPYKKSRNKKETAKLAKKYQSLGSVGKSIDIRTTAFKPALELEESKMDNRLQICGKSGYYNVKSKTFWNEEIHRQPI